jgi:N-acetylmuramoyl-L-alanine amidase
VARDPASITANTASPLSINPPATLAVSLSRRSALSALTTLGFTALLVHAPKALAAMVKATRVWPAADYTRVTFESDAALRYTQFFVKDPQRLVVDIEGVDLSAELADLANRVGTQDPYVQSVRVGRNRPGVIRIVFDLRTEVNPQVFTLEPVAQYGHRLVMDLYPLHPPDRLLQFLVEVERTNLAAQREEEASSDPIGSIARDGRLPSQPTSPAVITPTPVSPTTPSVKAPVTVSPPPDSATAPAKGQPTPPSPAVPPIASKPQPAPVKSPATRPVTPSVARLVIVALDAGHGGEDPGAIGAGGTYEKTVTLAIARRLAQQINGQPGMRAFLIRDGDYFIPLRDRIEKARKVEADLFVSIHADAWIKPTARGSSVFVLSERGATSEAARWMAKRENQSDAVGGVNFNVRDSAVARTLLDLTQTATINDSLKFGRAVLTEIGGINRLHKREVEQAGFAVLRSPDIPSILVETAFISNPDEEKRLASVAYQDKMAQAMLRGIRRYLARNPPLRVKS